MSNNKITRLQRELKNLGKQRAKAMKDESNAINKINRANRFINRTKSTGTIKSKEREIQRENDKAFKAKQKQANLSSKISNKNNQLNKAVSDLDKDRQKEQEKIVRDQENKIRESKLEQIQARDAIVTSSLEDKKNTAEVKSFDVFISHSTKDKDSYVDELAQALKKENIKIWYDSDTIGWGESIRQEIDKGLTHSKFGIVIISPSFIERYWTNYELDGILRREGSSGKQIILPIWHNVTADQVEEYSSPLSGRLAMNTSINTIAEIVANVEKLVS